VGALRSWNGGLRGGAIYAGQVLTIRR